MKIGDGKNSIRKGDWKNLIVSPIIFVLLINPRPLNFTPAGDPCTFGSP
jgi:hypothetical protein